METPGQIPKIKIKKNSEVGGKSWRFTVLTVADVRAAHFPELRIIATRTPWIL